VFTTQYVDWLAFCLHCAAAKDKTDMFIGICSLAYSQKPVSCLWQLDPNQTQGNGSEYTFKRSD
jgi:hypothetical protein